ncbi:torsin-4A [Neosynchiropus ocellatus]
MTTQTLTHTPDIKNVHKAERAGQVCGREPTPGIVAPPRFDCHTPCQQGAGRSGWIGLPPPPAPGESRRLRRSATGSFRPPSPASAPWTDETRARWVRWQDGLLWAESALSRVKRTGARTMPDLLRWTSQGVQYPAAASPEASRVCGLLRLCVCSLSGPQLASSPAVGPARVTLRSGAGTERAASLPQMSLSSTSESQSEEEQDGGQRDGVDERVMASPAPALTSFSSSLCAVVRIKQKYRALKRRRQEMSQARGGGGTRAGLPGHSSPKVFTFDPLSLPGASAGPQKKKRRRRKVLFPDRPGRRPAPGPEHSRAKYCLYLLCAIVFLQVYNAIENLDDHVLRYDLDGLEKTLRREVFGQQAAVESLLAHLTDYLSTYVHNKPLVLSLHGPSGVGKSHLGRLLATHFRAVVGEPLVLQYYVLHHCPLEGDAPRCARDLAVLVSRTVERAEEEEKIPVFVFDEAEHMHAEILDALRRLVAERRSNEYMNAIYVFLSGLGHQDITRHMLRNASSAAAPHLAPILRRTLSQLHPLWAEAALVPLGLLEKSHVTQCFLEELTREGFYPDRSNIERLAAEIEYYAAVAGREYSRTGCKQVVSKVNTL